MIRLPASVRCISLLSILAAATVGSAAAAAFDGKHLVFKDPAGDDKGPGKYTYPTGAEYKPGSFDLLGVDIKDQGDNLEFRIEVKAKLEDPWNSKSWGGNGFSLQMVQVYLDTKKGGFLAALPGINIKFPKGQAWDKVVFISPQPATKIVADVKTKAAQMLPGLVVPTRTYASGREIIAVVKKSDVGTPAKTWGFQVVMQSNEGYAKADSVLARAVNEYPGEHRFGGGSDHNCDPHAIDILAASATGADSEKDAQYKVLKAYTCDAAGNGQKAVVPMIYPGK